MTPSYVHQVKKEFMQRKRRTKPILMLNPDGQTRIIGMRRPLVGDLYYKFLTNSWGSSFVFIICLYLLVNLLFAGLYTLDPTGLANVRSDSFLDHFFFSVQTMMTVGYGYMYPKTLYTNLLATIEGIVSLITVAMITGLVFAKFSRPRARVIFSRHAVITDHDGVKTLMFRVANERGNYIGDASVHLAYISPGVTSEGRPFAKMIDLPVIRQRSPMFFLTWTVLHKIDEESPLFHATSEILKEAGAFIVCSLTGYDSTTGQTIHARHSYGDANIIWNRRMVDILTPAEDGNGLVINYHQFHNLEPESEAS